MTFMTFIDPDRGHVTSRGRSLFARCKEPGIRDLRVRVKNFKFGYPDFRCAGARDQGFLRLRFKNFEFGYPDFLME